MAPSMGVKSHWNTLPNSQGLSGRPLPPRLIAKVTEALVASKICTYTSASELVNSGRVTISDLSTVASNSGAFDRGCILINGHSLEELSRSHYIMHKPSSVSGAVCPMTKDSFRSYLPYPLMQIGWSSAIERSTRGLLFLLNDVELGNYLEKAALRRTYLVTTNSFRPLSPSYIDRLHSHAPIPFSKMEIIPHSMAELPPNSPIGSACEFTVRTSDTRPHVVRSLFNAIGISPGVIRLESVGGVSLSNFGLIGEGGVQLVSEDEIQKLASS